MKSACSRLTSACDRYRDKAVQLGRFGRNRSNVWRYPGVNSFSRKTDEGNLLALHPTVKPVALVADAILDCTARGDVVLDGFLGSGDDGHRRRAHRPTRFRDGVRSGLCRHDHPPLAEADGWMPLGI
jgi:hypothetical protein